jgi:hypothetical protein
MSQMTVLAAEASATVLKLIVPELPIKYWYQNCLDVSKVALLGVGVTVLVGVIDGVTVFVGVTVGVLV